MVTSTPHQAAPAWRYVGRRRGGSQEGNSRSLVGRRAPTAAEVVRGWPQLNGKGGRLGRGKSNLLGASVEEIGAHLLARSTAAEAAGAGRGAARNKGSAMGELVREQEGVCGCVVGPGRLTDRST